MRKMSFCNFPPANTFALEIMMLDWDWKCCARAINALNLTIIVITVRVENFTFSRPRVL